MIRELDRSHAAHSTPRYLAIADILQTEIAEGKYKTEERLPSEAQLCSRFRENRYAIRQALDILLYKGVIRSHQGKGHYLCEKPFDLQYTITPDTRFSKVIATLGLTPSARLLRSEKVIPPALVAEGLRLDAGEETFRLDILRCANRIPLAWNVTWLPVKYFPKLTDHINTLDSLYSVLDGVYDVQLQRIRSTVQAVYPTAEEAGHLAIPPSVNLLHIESVMRDGDYRLVEFTSAKYRGDLCRVSIKFE